ncbi:hypothetical protein J6590_004965 [Homalodisca vitripennis]|nr:hypothetical protein J6590_004965 [Homalodisca vitripennis]
MTKKTPEVHHHPPTLATNKSAGEIVYHYPRLHGHAKAPSFGRGVRLSLWHDFSSGFGTAGLGKYSRSVKNVKSPPVRYVECPPSLMPRDDSSAADGEVEPLRNTCRKCSARQDSQRTDISMSLARA